jgi:hypothetical protein
MCVPASHSPNEAPVESAAIAPRPGPSISNTGTSTVPPCSAARSTDSSTSSVARKVVHTTENSASRGISRSPATGFPRSSAIVYPSVS